MGVSGFIETTTTSIEDVQFMELADALDDVT